MANPIVTGLTAYVEQEIIKDKLIAKTALGAKSAKMFNLLVNVKGPSTLNLLATDPVIQDAHSCGFTASGSTEISQRLLNPAYLKVDHEWCEKELLGTYAQYKVRTAASQQDEEEFAFEKEFVDGVIEKINEAQEKMIYQGVSGATSHDGLITILSGATGVIKVEKASGTSVYNALKEVYLAIPEAVVEKQDCVILVGPQLFRKFIQDLVTANQYHWTPTDTEGEYKLPGTGCRVISVAGLANTSGADYIIAGRLSNIFFGVDIDDEQTMIDLWFSKDDRTWKFESSWVAGVQVAYPDEMVLGSIAKA